MPAPAKLRIIAMPEVTADIYAQWKADIAARDWSRVHIRGDRAPALFLVDRIKRTWWR